MTFPGQPFVTVQSLDMRASLDMSLGTNPRRRNMNIMTPMRITLIIACTMQLSCGHREESAITPSVVKITATYNPETNEHLFVTDVDEIPSGWTTFRLINASPAVHFLVLELLPGAKSVENSVSEVVPVFQQAMDLISGGQVEDGFAKLADLPKWFGDVRFMGGPGLVSPGRSSEATVHLEHGNYVMECYIKTAEGKFHSALGMIRGLTVTQERSEAAPPSQVSLRMRLTNEGFGVHGEVSSGRHTIEVRFAEEKPPFLGNDVHLVQLGEDANLEKLATWMDWSQPGGMVSDHGTAAPFQFMGGTHEMPMGSTAYFTVELTPGRYAWVSERSAQDPLYEEFTVAAR